MEPYYEDDHATIYHADCLELIGDLEFDVVVTDPPYGIGWRSGGLQSRYDSNGPNQRTETLVAGDKTCHARDAALAMMPNNTPAIVFGSWKQTRPPETERVLIWDKKDQHPGPVNHAWFTAHEEIYLIGSGWVGKPHRSVFTTTGNRSVTAKQSGHPTSKPLSLMTLLVSKCPLGTVLDPFMGSGTTLRAAKDLGRKSIGIELEEKYCEIAAKRLAQEVLDFG